MEEFKKDFEFRRNIFGLTSIINTPPNMIPQLVSERLPVIMLYLTKQANLAKQERVEVLLDNEKHLNKL